MKKTSRKESYLIPTFFIYTLLWIYSVWGTLPEALFCLRHVVGEEIVYYIFDNWVFLDEYTFWPYLYLYCPLFLIFMGWFGLCLKKAGNKRVILTVVINLILPCIAPILRGVVEHISIKHCLIGFMVEVFVLIITVSTVMKVVGMKITLSH